MNYKYFHITVILDSGNEINFVLSGQDSNAIGLVVSKLPNIHKIKNIRLATEADIPNDEE
jgi:hypothetical protein